MHVVVEINEAGLLNGELNLIGDQGRCHGFLHVGQRPDGVWVLGVGWFKPRFEETVLNVDRE